MLSSGVLASQFGQKGGNGLVKDLASSKHGTWGWGEIRFTDAYNIDKGGASPKNIVHFCVQIQPQYEGPTTYLVSVSKNLYSIAILVLHELLLSSTSMTVLVNNNVCWQPQESVFVLRCCFVFC